MDANAAEQAIARIIRMREEARELTKALGLPPEATYTVMTAMHEAKTSLVTFPQPSVQQAHPETSVSNDPRLEQVYQLSESFLGKRMKGQIATFRALWKTLKDLQIDDLAKNQEQLAKTSSGFGFVGSSPILSVVSVISWAVANWPYLSKSNTLPQLQDRIIEEAEARGCSSTLSRALALYLSTEMSK